MAPWTPPAPQPPVGQNIWRVGLRTFRSQIEGLTPPIFTEPCWRPLMPGLPLFVTAPELIEEVFLTRADVFTQGALLPRMMKPAWGRGMFISTGEEWRSQRRMAAPAFRPSAIQSLIPRFTGAAKNALDEWKEADGGVIELHAAMQRLTFAIIVDVLLSGAGDIDVSAMRQEFMRLFGDMNGLRPSYILMPDAWHAGRPPAHSKHRSGIINRIRALLAARRETGTRGDLVYLLLAARDPETGASLPDDLLADNILGFVLAGYETTAVALTWAVWLAASHKPTLRSLRREWDAEIGGDVSADTVDRLVFTQQVIKESLRLYPPAHSLTRVCQAPARLGPYDLKRGDRIMIPIYALHRHTTRWENPHQFDPDRFAPDRPEPGRYAFMPFGAGPRICIGMPLAMAELTAILPTLLRSTDYETLEPERIWPHAGLALYPRHGIRVRVRPLGVAA